MLYKCVLVGCWTALATSYSLLPVARCSTRNKVTAKLLSSTHADVSSQGPWLFLFEMFQAIALWSRTLLPLLKYRKYPVGQTICTGLLLGFHQCLRSVRWVPPAPPVKVKRSCLCKLLLLSSSLHCMHCGLKAGGTGCVFACTSAWVFPLGRFHSFVCSHMPMFDSWFIQSCFFGSSCYEHASCWGPNTTVANRTSSMFLLFPYAVFCSLRFFLRRWWRNSGLADPIMQTT